MGLVAAFHGLDCSSDRDRRSLDDAIQGALKLATLLDNLASDGLGAPARDADRGAERGELGAALATLGTDTTGHGDRLGISLLPLMLRWFDCPDTLAGLWERATQRSLPEAVALGAVVLGRSLTHDPQSIQRCLARPAPDRLWTLAAGPLADWQTSDRGQWDWPQRLRSPHSDAVPLLVALHSTIGSGGRWATALARSQHYSASAALWTGVLVGALGGITAIPALAGATVPDSTLSILTRTAQQLIDQWSGRIPSQPGHPQNISPQNISSMTSRRASGPPLASGRRGTS